jgi:hypothetical protein
MASRRELVLNNFYKLGIGNSRQLRKYSYAILLSDFLKSNSEVPRFADRFLMYSHVIKKYELSNRPLQYYEFGVFEGNSIKYWLQETLHSDSEYFGFDSFEGLPEDWFEGMGKGAFDLNGKLPDIKDNRAHFIKGWFNESLPEFVKAHSPSIDKQIVLHLDADLYSSTYYVLNFLHFCGYIRKGTILIFDEIIVASIADTEFRAFYDFVEVMGLKYEVLGIAKYEMALIII